LSFERLLFFPLEFIIREEDFDTPELLPPLDFSDPPPFESYFCSYEKGLLNRHNDLLLGMKIKPWATFSRNAEKADTQQQAYILHIVESLTEFSPQLIFWERMIQRKGLLWR
jgi:hypothetical protein